MGTLALMSLCIGAALGLRFQVFALFPVILLGFIVITAWGLSAGQTGWSILLMNAVGASCLQFGYLAGRPYYNYSTSEYLDNRQKHLNSRSTLL